MYRLHPSWLAVRELVASGRIGRLLAVHSWFSYYNDDPTNIRNIRAVGGGALYDIGCYNVNLSRMLFGGEPDRVEAAITRDAADGRGHPDQRAAALRRWGGDLHLHDAGRARPAGPHLRHARAGSRSASPSTSRPTGRRTIFVTAGGDPPVAPATETLTFATADPYTVEAERFAAAILDDLPTPVAARRMPSPTCASSSHLRGRLSR